MFARWGGLALLCLIPAQRAQAVFNGGVEMNSKSLRDLQAPFKERYKSEPEAALIRLEAKGNIDESEIACTVESSSAMVEAGLHPSTGGTGLQACSGDMLLEALCACAGVTLRAVATALEISVEEGSVHATGIVDMRGTLGVASEAPVGFKNIDLTFELKSEATEEELALLIKLTERYCVVLQTLTCSPKLTVNQSAGVAA